MKKRQFVFLIILLFTAVQCSKSNGDSLPQETQTGANTFGCLVNGKVFLPKDGRAPAFGHGVLECNFPENYQGPSGFSFHLQASDLSIQDNVTGLYINCDSVTFTEGQTYTLSNAVRGNASAAYLHLGTGTGLLEYPSPAGASGQLQITKFDQTKHIVAGTFWFNGISNNGVTLKITEGRFDMTYPYLR